MGIGFPTSGSLIARVVSAATTNSTLVKGAAGVIQSITVSNINVATRYLKLYNKATAPTVGTDTPVMTIALQGLTTTGSITHHFGQDGIYFSTGIGLGLTTGVADNDTGAVAANEQIVHILYQ